MKDLGAAKKILGMRITRDKKNHKLTFMLLSLKFRQQMVTRIQHRQTVMRSPMDQNYRKSISKGSKTMQPMLKLKFSMTTQSARAHAQNKNAGKMHMRPMHDCGRKNMRTCENDAFMRVVSLPPTSGSTSKLI
jgi:hypothetical protein